MVTPGSRASPSGSRRKPARSYIALAVAIHSVVCRAMRGLPAARAMYERAGFAREPEGDGRLPGLTILAYAADL